MKRNKILGGLVMAAVLLSGTTVLYFAGVERPGVTPALGAPDPGGCPAGTFCAVDLGTGGGCNPVDCCPPGQDWCGSWYRETVSFQEIGSLPGGSLGSCWKYSTYDFPYCNEWWCNNFYACPAVYCQRAEPKFVVRRHKPVQTGGSCGGVAE